MKTTCPECSSENLFYETGISSAGGYGPKLLSGLGSFFYPPNMKVILCTDCGLMRLYADQDARDKAPKKWKPVNPA